MKMLCSFSVLPKLKVGFERKIVVQI